MDYKEILRRANLNSLQSYLKYGAEDYEEPSDKTYSQRIKEARSKATQFFKERYTDIDEYDEIVGYFYEQVAVCEEVSFEIGLMVGAKIAFQLRGKMDDLALKCK